MKLQHEHANKCKFNMYRPKLSLQHCHGFIFPITSIVTFVRIFGGIWHNDLSHVNAIDYDKLFQILVSVINFSIKPRCSCLPQQVIIVSWCVQNYVWKPLHFWAYGTWLRMSSQHNIIYNALEKNGSVWQRNSTHGFISAWNKSLQIICLSLTINCFFFSLFFLHIYSIALKLRTIAFQFNWCFLHIFKITKNCSYTLYPSKRFVNVSFWWHDKTQIGSFPHPHLVK